MPITDRQLAAKITDKKERWLSDASARGAGQFCARTVGSNRPVFYFRYTDHKGKQARINIGKYDKAGNVGLTLKGARAKAGEFSLLYQKGVRDIKGHLEAEKARVKAERVAEEDRLEAERRAAEIEASRKTVTGLFEKWEELKLSKRKDGAELRRIFEKDILPEIGHLPAHTVRKGHITTIIDKVELRGANRMAKIVFTSLRTMFRYALQRDYVDINPTDTIIKADIGGSDVERDRELSDDEIRTLAKQMPSAGLMKRTEVAVWVALATGCRIGELLRARWEHVDLEGRSWLIPSENSKNKDPLKVYLSDFVLRQFKVLEQQRQSDWLYPARNKKMGDTHVSVKTVTKQIGDRQRAEVMKNRSKSKVTLSLTGGCWTMHDLRRTASTLMGSLGVKPVVIDRCLNQKETNRLRRTYQRYNYQPEMNQAWRLLGERLEALTKEQRTAEVIFIRAKG